MWLLTFITLILMCTSTSESMKVPLEVEPPMDLLHNMAKAKIDFCGNGSRTLFVFYHHWESFYNYQYHLIASLGESYFLINDLRLINEKRFSVDCGIFLVEKRLIETQAVRFQTKLIFISESFETKPPGFVTENDYELDSISIEHTPSGVLPSVSTVARNEPNFRDLHRLHVMFFYYPIEGSKAAMKYFWKTITMRHNLTERKPSMLLNFQTLEPMEPFSMHQTRYAECFIVPKGRQRPIELVLIYPFDTFGWICIILTIGVVLLLFRLTVDRSSTLTLLFLEMIRTILSGPHAKPSSAFERKIVTIFVIGNLVLITTYQSLITAVITRPSFYPALDTVEQINGSCAVDARVQFGRSSYNFQKSSKAAVLRKYTQPDCIQVTCFIFYELKMMCKYLELGNRSCQSYRKSHAEVLLVPILGAVSSPWSSVTNLVRFYADAFAECGLYHFAVEALETGVEKGNDLVRPLVVGDLDLVWRILAIGWILCGGAFVGEIIFFRGMRHMFSPATSFGAE